MKVLAINGLDLLGIASKLNAEAYAVVSRGDVEEFALRAARVYVVRTEDLHALAHAVVKVAESLKPDVIALHSNKDSRTLAGIVAGKLNAPILSDVMDLEVVGGGLRVKRLTLGNRAIVVEESPLPAVVTAAANRFQVPPTSERGVVEEIRAEPMRTFRLVGREEKARGAVRLEEAELIVSIGRGFKRMEDLKLAFELANLLNAQVGCSRPIAADLKWLPEEHWVGLSGKKVRPKAYIALGISGQPQHIAGILEARTVIAVNNDPNAPIFKFADLGVVEDLYKLVPALMERLRRLKKTS